MSVSCKASPDCFLVCQIPLSCTTAFACLLRIPNGSESGLLSVHTHTQPACILQRRPYCVIADASFPLSISASHPRTVSVVNSSTSNTMFFAGCVAVVVNAGFKHNSCVPNCERTTRLGESHCSCHCFIYVWTLCNHVFERTNRTSRPNLRLTSLIDAAIVGLFQSNHLAHNPALVSSVQSSFACLLR